MPPPPDVAAQGQPTPAINQGKAQPNGPSQGQLIQQIQSSLAGFEKSTGDLYEFMKDADPQSMGLFKQLATIGTAIKERVAKVTQAQGQGAATPAPAAQATNPAEEPPGPVAQAA
jgi:hypothetical protein